MIVVQTFSFNSSRSINCELTVCDLQPFLCILPEFLQAQKLLDSLMKSIFMVQQDLFPWYCMTKLGRL